MIPLLPFPSFFLPLSKHKQIERDDYQNRPTTPPGRRRGQGDHRGEIGQEGDQGDPEGSGAPGEEGGLVGEKGR